MLLWDNTYYGNGDVQDISWPNRPRPELIAMTFFGEMSLLASDSAQGALKLSIFSPAELRVAVVERSQVGLLGDEWSSSGVYVLLERPDGDGNWRGCRQERCR